MLDINQLRFAYSVEDKPMEFSLRVNAGEVLSVIGPSGAGKTTLINLIAGFLAPQSGEITVHGQSINTMTVAQRPVSIVFQQFNLFPHLDVVSNVALGLRPSLKLSDPDRQRIAKVLESMDLKGLDNRLPSELSGGQQQRVALARAIIRDRPVLLLDEAFTALGPSLRGDLLALVRQLVADYRMMAISIGHQPTDAGLISEQVAFIDQGQVVEQGPVDQLLNNSINPVIKDYLGTT